MFKAIEEPRAYPRGYFASKLRPAREVRLIQVTDEVWDAFGGDMTAIEKALASLAQLVASAKSLPPKKAKPKTKKRSAA
ncbi:MAG: hypothetical protein FWD73_01340 [Polyangiaceae bacterium]|nr:hypothetical protein [Polyangiaceae bacterium]